MSCTKYLRIHYGPNESFHTLTHRPQKLNGLRDALRRLGYRVDLVPEHNIINYCMIEMCGFDIFQCNINHLLFNRPSKLDPVCQRAVAAVLDATRVMMRAEDHRWAWMMLEDQVFKKVYFDSQKENASFDECFECCQHYNCSIQSEANEANQLDSKSKQSDDETNISLFSF